MGMGAGRIGRIIKLDQDVQSVTKEATALIGKAMVRVVQGNAQAKSKRLFAPGMDCSFLDHGERLLTPNFSDTSPGPGIRNSSRRW